MPRLSQAAAAKRQHGDRALAVIVEYIVSLFEGQVLGG